MKQNIEDCLVVIEDLCEQIGIRVSEIRDSLED